MSASRQEHSQEHRTLRVEEHKIGAHCARNSWTRTDVDANEAAPRGLVRTAEIRVMESTAHDQAEYDRYRELQMMGTPFDRELQPPFEIHIDVVYQYREQGRMYVICRMRLLNRSTRALYLGELVKVERRRVRQDRLQVIELGTYSPICEPFYPANDKPAMAEGRDSNRQTEPNPMRGLDLNPFFQGAPLPPGKLAKGFVQLEAVSPAAHVNWSSAHRDKLVHTTFASEKT